MTKILLVRHGHVEGIEPARFRGRAELPLTARGHAEANAAARRIASAWHSSQVYSSPLQRSVKTATAIAHACNCPAVVLDSLTDMDYGQWQLLSHVQARQEDPRLYDSWLSRPHLVRFPKGESLQDLVLRAADALRFALERHPDETIVLVGHDSVNRAMLLQLLDQPLSAYWRITQDPCCINEVDVDLETISCRRINDTAHLDNPKSSPDKGGLS